MNRNNIFNILLQKKVWTL